MTDENTEGARGPAAPPTGAADGREPRSPFRITTKRAALWTLALTALLWSSSGILVKSVDWNPMAVASARGLISGITIWILSAEG
ncbi:MAG: hypothetical protein LBQ12_13070, partial [Deltaproteobacteria bacterium]|nr:hypothetical protein [Deltaproteobacteria bacterium]